MWRGVETQYLSATTLLVDTVAEHDVLEGMLEASKPPLPAERMPGQHYLLVTPFRYAPQRSSRFRAVGQRGVWYGSRELRAACAEVAYWRMEFILDSIGLRDDKIVSQHTFFAAHVAGVGIDLTRPPWVAARAVWTDGRDYSGTQRLAAAATTAGIQVVQYESVRSPRDTNFAVFTPAALTQPDGGLSATQQPWDCIAMKERAIMVKRGDPSQRFEWER